MQRSRQQGGEKRTYFRWGGGIVETTSDSGEAVVEKSELLNLWGARILVHCRTWYCRRPFAIQPKGTRRRVRTKERRDLWDCGLEGRKNSGDKSEVRKNEVLDTKNHFNHRILCQTCENEAPCAVRSGLGGLKSRYMEG